MCISLFLVKIVSEVLYVGEVQHTLHGYIHVFGYRAVMHNLHNGPNALIFPVPAKLLMEQENILQGSVIRVLEDITGVFLPTAPLSNITKKDALTAVASGARTISQTLEYLSPGITEREYLYAMLGEFYPDHHMVISAFDPHEGPFNASVWFWYVPQRPEMFFVPTFESQNGNFDIATEVHCNRWILVGSDASSEVVSFEPRRVMERHVTGWYRNADTIASVDAVHSGLSEGVQRRPFTGTW